MYSADDGYDAAEQRIKRLLAGNFNSEALVTAVFTAEKTLRRTLRELIVRAGFISSHADQLLRAKNGIQAIKEHWMFFDPDHRALTALLPPVHWQAIQDAATMRNKMVHGERVYTTKQCIDCANAVLKAIKDMMTVFDREYSYSGWTKHRKRTKSGLHLVPYKRTS
jgi:hypothetical protein